VIFSNSTFSKSYYKKIKNYYNEKLSRNEMKNVMGGTACSYTWQDSAGAWHTETGHCATTTTAHLTFGGGTALNTLEYLMGETIGFCSTPSHQNPTTLTSNGGVSKCKA
jgi:hypothetical protein